MTLEHAFRSLLRIAELKPLRVSSVYETPPVGGPAQGAFLNAVWKFETLLPPPDLLSNLLRCEKRLGRVRSEKNAPRTIDLDLLAYGDDVLTEGELILPHPRMHERWFVLKPLCDIDPEWIHPVLHQSAGALLAIMEKAKGIGGRKYLCDIGIPSPAGLPATAGKPAGEGETCTQH